MTARDRRALLLGVGTVVVAVLALRLVPAAVRAVLAWRARVAEQRETLAREQDLLGAVPTLRDSLGLALAGVVALAPSLVAAGTTAEAAASLASLVTLAASRHDIKVVRMDPLPDSAAGVFARVAVHAELEGDVRGLTQVLRALETGQPLLTVMAMSVDAPTPTGPTGAREVLRISLTVAGYGLRKGSG